MPSFLGPIDVKNCIFVLTETHMTEVWGVYETCYLHISLAVIFQSVLQSCIGEGEKFRDLKKHICLYTHMLCNIVNSLE